MDDSPFEDVFPISKLTRGYFLPPFPLKNFKGNITSEPFQVSPRFKDVYKLYVFCLKLLFSTFFFVCGFFFPTKKKQKHSKKTKQKTTTQMYQKSVRVRPGGLVFCPGLGCWVDVTDRIGSLKMRRKKWLIPTWNSFSVKPGGKSWWNSSGWEVGVVGKGELGRGLGGWDTNKGDMW